MTDAKTPSGDDLASLRLDKTTFSASGRRRRFLAPALVAATIIVAVGGAGIVFRQRGRQVETVTVPPPGRPPSDVVVTATGYVVARRKAAVGAKIAGRLAWLGVEEGSRVRGGELIARLESEDLAASVRAAEARILAARSDLAEARARQVELDREVQRRRSLLDTGIGARSDWEVSTAAADAGRARVSALDDRIKAEEAAAANASAILDNSFVRAPFDGVVLTKDAEVGETVAPAVGGGGTTRGSMVTMADMDSLEVEADVSESSIARLELGGKAEIVLDAFPERVYPAVVHQIVPTADRQKATVQVKVRFTEDRTGALPEMSAKVNFLSREAGERGKPRRVIVLPASAVRKVTGGWVVLGIEQGRVKELPVGLERPPDRGQAEIISGLEGGETVLAEPPAELAAGSKVRARQ
jgi:RND family efflux transporter MFP subunit